MYFYKTKSFTKSSEFLKRMNSTNNCSQTARQEFYIIVKMISKVKVVLSKGKGMGPPNSLIRRYISSKEMREASGHYPILTV